MTVSENDRDTFEILEPTRPEVSLQRLGRRRFVLSLSGYFASGWQARVAAALSGAGSSIVSGFTACDGFGHWRGEVEFDTSDGSRDPESIDFVALVADGDIPRIDRELCFDAIELLRVPDYGECLRLAVRGEDGVGILAVLLATCAEHELYPLELRVRTLSGKIDDLAYLKSKDLTPPSEEIESRLRAWLHARLA